MSASNTILIYADNQTPRLEFIVSTLFQGKANITHDLDHFIAYDGPQINYSAKAIPGITCHICPHGILEQEHIAEQAINIIQWNGYPAFFETKGTIPFDLFSAAFYLITRYEEWLPHQKDTQGRYQSEQSLAYQNGFLQFPLVNFWVEQLTNNWA